MGRRNDLLVSVEMAETERIVQIGILVIGERKMRGYCRVSLGRIEEGYWKVWT